MDYRGFMSDPSLIMKNATIDTVCCFAAGLFIFMVIYEITREG